MKKQLNTALAFYQHAHTAHSVFQKLKKHGFRSVLTIQNTSEGYVCTKGYDYSKTFIASIFAIAIAFIGGIFFAPKFDYLWVPLLIILGILSICFVYLHRKNIIKNNLINRYKSCVLRDETLLLVQIRDKDVRQVLNILRLVESNHPTSFLLRYEPKIRFERDQEFIKEPLTLDNLQEQAKQLAKSFKKVNYKKTPGHPLKTRLLDSSRILHDIRHNVAEAKHIEQSVTLSAEWLLDNTYIIQGNIEEVNRGLPINYYRQLPKLEESEFAKLPRVYAIASKLIEYTANALTKDNIIAFLNSYMVIDHLTIGELWALPLMLRLCLIERMKSLAIHLDRRLREGELASYWGNRLLNAAQREPEYLDSFIKHLNACEPHPSPYFAEELIEHLYDEDNVLSLVKKWIEEKLSANVHEIMQKEQMQQTKDEVAFSSAVISIIVLSQLSWKEIFETVSPVDQILKKDPTGIYSKMDFVTRDSYRHSLETVARRSKHSESEIADDLLKMAENGTDEVTRHVGYYLVDDGRPKLEASLSCCPTYSQRFRRWLNAHPTLVYLGSIGLLTVLIECYLFRLSAETSIQRFIFLFLAFIPISEISIQLINMLLPSVLPPFILPKMSFDKGIPEDHKTLVIIPTLLSSPESIQEILHLLEVHYLGNQDPALKFGLFFDYTDAPKETMDEDASLFDIAVKGMKNLEDKYGPKIFFLFLRRRTWNPHESAWIGWERKRGKLESLNRFLTENSYSEPILVHGQREDLKNVRYVITLDSDTQLPKDKAKQLIETIAHPLNSPHVSTENTIRRGYTIIQPKVCTDFLQAQHTWFSRIFADVIGLDPYAQTSSNVYQDLTREGIYHGKCIYDVRTFNQILSKRFPEEHLLSHDLLEGNYVRVGYASDISLYDQFPETYLSWSKRQHRWMRGDWQIIDWLFSKVPDSTSQKKTNPLSLINRWKIFDNLRRALFAPAIFILIVVSLLFSVLPSPWILLSYLAIFIPALNGFVMNVVNYFKSRTISWKEIFNGFARSITQISLLPYEAKNSLDAFIRVIYRRNFSHAKLLEWSMGNNGGSHVEHRRFIKRLGIISLLALALAFGTYYLHPASLIWALPICVLWFLSPLIVSFLDDTALCMDQYQKKISNTDRLWLRKVGRKTWRFFDDFVGPQTNWLPPDNYQSDLLVEVAQRTSTTNIGLWLLSVISAHDLNYITYDDAIDRLQGTFETIKKLEVHEGHLLNWYDTHSLAPLRPRYVSSVDNGNLLACLWTLEQSLHQLLESPVIPRSFFYGFQDTYELLCEKKNSRLPNDKLLRLKTLFYSKPSKLSHAIKTIKESSMLVSELLNTSQISEEQTYWLNQLEKQLQSWLQCYQRYLEWVEILEDAPQDKMDTIDQFSNLVQKAMQFIPSLSQIASGSLFVEIHQYLDSLQNVQPEVKGWMNKLKEAMHKAQWLAGEKLDQSQQIIQETIRISQTTNMEFLYNKDRKLLSIGYHVEDCKLDASYYDLLASEARVASLISIAKGDLPLEHWWSLGRPYRSVDGMKVLVSWGGTMFEYLMPALFMKQYPDSLLGNACTNAVKCQINYGNKRGIPWGISESAFSEIDARKTYQYRSFGVPDLGFKRGLENDLVVSPYSSALALIVNPTAAIRNLQKLSTGSLDLYDAYGYYESIDFAREHGPHGERGIIAYAYMAHHQGMSLIAINNVLNDHPMVNRFHEDPRISGVQSLLYERIPFNPPITRGYRKEPPPARVIPFSALPIMGVVDTPHTIVPKINLLANGEYSIMLTNTGGGYSKWRNIDITRWYADTTCDKWGSFCYIKDLETGKYWSSTYQPTYASSKKFSVRFKSDKVEFHRRDNLIETTTEIAVSPQDNAEVRLMTLANLSKKTIYLELTSYSELALAPHNTDRSHPCFNKFFIQTEAIPLLSGILAFRRLRSADDQPIYAAHIVTSDQSTQNSLQYETDRTLFIGRGNTLSNPDALNKNLNNSEGYVLDPIFSLRRHIVLKPGERAQVSFITAVADDRDQIIELMKKYGDIKSTHRALEMAWTHAQLQMRHLRIHQDETQLFQKLASYILYPHRQLRLSSDRLCKNRLSQSRLWAYGISGDLPIIAVTVADIHELELVKQVLLAHSFWRLRGLKVDLVLLNEEAESYEHPLFAHLQNIIYSNAYGSDIGQPGGIFLLNCDQMPEEDVVLILATARANLIAARGFLRQHLISPVETITYPSRLVIKNKIQDEPSRSLPFLELPYFNGLGGFTPDGREYVIHLDSNKHTPAPWINVISNPQFGTLVSESGLGSTWYGNSQTNRLTAWSNDPLLNPITDTIYIRDDELGTYWTSTPSPIRELDPYRIRHGQGYSRIEHNSHGIEQDLLVFVPVDESGGLPLRIQRLHLFNNTPRSRILSIFPYVEPVLGTNKEETQMHLITEWDLESQALFVYNHFNPDFCDHAAFVCSNLPITSYTGSRSEFIGRNHHAANPAALKRKSLSKTCGGGLDPCAALHVGLELKPGEHTEIIFVLGYTSEMDKARKLISLCKDSNWIESTFQQTLAYWDGILGTLKIESPDLFINFALNRWLVYQDLSCRIWGRTAFYQSSGAYGYRDQLQDVMALLYTKPQIAREQIVRAASRQFVEGDVQHWWLPPTNGGVRTHISDDFLWLPYVVAQYVRITDDQSILEENIAFIKGELLKKDQHDAFFIPELSSETGTVLEHCRRAIQRSLASTGPRGLPLIGSGDWNDGMNNVGIGGKGESVWLGWFLIHVLNDFAYLLDKTGQPDAGKGYLEQAKKLAEIIEETSWDGQWYIRAYFDDGTPIGSKSNEEDFIDSIAQSWSIMSGAANLERASIALKSVEEHLIRYKERLVLLMTPAFDKTPLDPGYIKGYPPGVRENGGQYTHGSIWTALAFARMGEGDKAVEILRMMHPVMHTQTMEDVERYKAEPYVSIGDVYALEGKMGRGGWSWYTGSTAWMYRIWLEEIIGFQLRGKVLRLQPTLPKDWESLKLTYRYLSSNYQITLMNPRHVCRGNCQTELDGVVLKGDEIHLVDDGRTHSIVVTIL